MRHLLILAGTIPLIMIPAAPANAAIHEMVSAFCSGGGVGVIGTDGFLEPPGVTTPGKESFRKPASASGVVDTSVSPAVIGSSPAAKYPAGTVVRDLTTSDSLHPSTHCANAPP
jgi:hypothetical protein